MRFLIIAIATGISSDALSKTTNIPGNIDNVLDRLEERLIDQEAQDLGLNYLEKSKNKTNNFDTIKDQSQKKQSFKKHNISTTPNELLELKTLENLVNQIENQADHFAQTVQKTSQDILGEASIDNFTEINISLTDVPFAAITSMKVSMDGFTLYEAKDAAGIWMPTEVIPIYSGPFPPGNHRLDLEIQLRKKRDETLKVYENTYHFINKSFDIDIQTLKQRKKYTISVTNYSKKETLFDAKLEVSQ